MTTEFGLDRLCPGESGVVIAVGGEDDMKRRLEEMGWVVGTRVDCLMVSPLGDPVAYRIRGATIALRRTDAEHITVMPWSPQEACDEAP